MSVVALIADSVLLLGMVCVSLYGAAVLPASARMPVHFGPAGYNRWVSRNVGLLLWPGIGAVVYLFLVFTGHSPQAGASPRLTGLTVALVVMLVAQVGALRVALNRDARR